MVRSARQEYSFYDYAELDAASTLKHEYLDGWVWAMAGGSPEHAGIAASVVVQQGAAELPAIGCQLAIDEIYRDPLA
jgi:hypothetical protein